MSQTTTDHLREILHTFKKTNAEAWNYDPDNDGMVDRSDVAKIHKAAETEALARLAAILAAERLDGIKQPILKYDMTTAIAVKDLCDDRIEQLKKQAEA